MGTRCLTIVKDNDQAIINMYAQWDGYPTGHGRALKDFLKPFIVSYGRVDKPNTANGAGCLAGQIIAHFKKGNGGFYIYAPDQRDIGEEFIYTVYINTDGEICITVEDTSVDKPLYNGLIMDYVPTDPT